MKKENIRNQGLAFLNSRLTVRVHLMWIGAFIHADELHQRGWCPCLWPMGITLTKFFLTTTDKSNYIKNSTNTTIYLGCL